MLGKIVAVAADPYEAATDGRPRDQALLTPERHSVRAVVTKEKSE
jgi:hypothetical protein